MVRKLLKLKEIKNVNVTFPQTFTSLAFFRSNWLSWKFLGFVTPSSSKPGIQGNVLSTLYIVYAIAVHAVVTISFPIHLSLGIFESTSKPVFFDAVSISVTSIGATIKTLIFINKLHMVRRIENILMLLDERIIAEDEREYFRTHMCHNVAQVQNIFMTIYVAVGIVGGVSFATSQERRLFYPGWFPLDWRHSDFNFAMAITYQLFCIFQQISHNFTNDSFSPKALCVLSGHIKLWYSRISKIGNTNVHMEGFALEEQEIELLRCVRDQTQLYEILSLIQNIISWPMFMQIFVSMVNSCVAMVALVFFVTDIVGRIYYVIYIVGVIMQLFLTCYYGSTFVLMFEELHYAIFSSNWIGQTQSYKRNMMIFTERSLRKTVAMAGNMFPIHLNTFFAACKGGYSLFAVIMAMK